MNICKRKDFLFVAYICFISSLFMYGANCSEDKPLDEDRNNFYLITEIEFSSKPIDFLYCTFKFSEPEKSLNTINFITNISNIPLVLPYRVDSEGVVQIQDLREVSQWKIIRAPSLIYTYHFSDVKNQYTGIEKNVFHPFLSSNNTKSFGEYKMSVEFSDRTGIEFSFSKIFEIKEGR